MYLLHCLLASCLKKKLQFRSLYMQTATMYSRQYDDRYAGNKIRKGKVIFFFYLTGEFIQLSLRNRGTIRMLNI